MITMMYVHVQHYQVLVNLTSLLKCELVKVS